MTGAAIMIVEILGAKMLSPFVGLSHFVWTAQIAVTLVALACGYYVGGRLSDQSQRLDRLYWAILGAALYLVLTVWICEPVAYWCLDFNLAIGSLLASGILFFIPLALLAMTGPFLVRVITSSVAGVGGNVGRLTSIGTLGSLAGTLLIGYLLIPLLPNSLTMYFTALSLMVVCAGYFLLCRRKWPAVLALLLALGSAAGGKSYLVGCGNGGGSSRTGGMALRIGGTKRGGTGNVGGRRAPAGRGLLASRHTPAHSAPATSTTPATSQGQGEAGGLPPRAKSL